MGSHLDFIPLAYSLQNQYHCLLFDLPGHGRASLEDPLEAVKKTLLHEGPYEILLGYSMGGRILLHLLPLRLPPRLRAVFTLPILLLLNPL